jgi:hypothetical protein
MLDQLSNANREIREFNQRLAEEIDHATKDLSRKNMALGPAQSAARQSPPGKRLESAPGHARPAGGPTGPRNRHAAVLGFGPPAARPLQRDLAPTLRERLEVASREIVRIGRIVRDYLDSTRGLEPECKPTSLRQLLHEAVEVTGGFEQASKPMVGHQMSDEPRVHDRSGIASSDSDQSGFERLRRRRCQGSRCSFPPTSTAWSTSPSAIRGRVSRPKISAAFSSRSTRPRDAAKAPGLDSPSAVSCPRPSAAPLKSRARPAKGPPSPFICRLHGPAEARYRWTQIRVGRP